MQRLLLFLLFTFILTGCGAVTKNTGNEADQPAIEGYVTATETGRYLVVSNEPFYLNESNPQFVDALWVSTKERLEVGDYVRVWADAIATSYPGQTGADRLEIIPKNLHSTLTVKEVIAAVAENFVYYPIITNVHYDKKNNEWGLQYQDTIRSNGLIGIVMKDQQPLTLGEPIYEQPPNVMVVKDGERLFELYVQSYEWTYTDIFSRQEKHMEDEIPISHLFPSFSEAATMEHPGELVLDAGGLEILHSEIAFLDIEMNEVAKILDGKGDIPTGAYYMQVTLQFKQGTAVYVNTVNFK